MIAHDTSIFQENDPETGKQADAGISYNPMANAKKARRALHLRGICTVLICGWFRHRWPC
ncbi:hypothetical protein O9929_15190 [Vibrio lentus]|nr:hypothetical protein [Vibrio lentus]